MTRGSRRKNVRFYMTSDHVCRLCPVIFARLRFRAFWLLLSSVFQGGKAFEDDVVFDIVFGICQISSTLFFMMSSICIESFHCTSFRRPFCAVAARIVANFRVDQVWHMKTCVRVDCTLHFLSCTILGIPVAYLRLLFALLPPICDSFE